MCYHVLSRNLLHVFLKIYDDVTSSSFLLSSRDDLRQINNENVVSVKFLQENKIIVQIIMIIVKGVDTIKGTERIKWIVNFYAMQLSLKFTNI